jgi:hypothetical protein
VPKLHQESESHYAVHFINFIDFPIFGSPPLCGRITRLRYVVLLAACTFYLVKSNVRSAV